MLRAQSIAGALFALALTASLARAADGPKGTEWPQYQGGPGLSGHSPDESVKPPFKLLWTYRLDGDATSDAGRGVTVAGGLVYINVSNTRSLLALDADTGRLRWEYSDTYPGYRTVPNYSHGRLFLWERAKAKKPRVLALDAMTGKVLWNYALRGEHVSELRTGLPINYGMVYCSEGGEEPAILALDEKTGKQIWRTPLGKNDGTMTSPLSVAGGRVFVATRSVLPRGKTVETGAIVALDAKTGKQLWRRKATPVGRPLFTDGEALASLSGGPEKLKFSLLDAKTGETLWTFAKPFGIENPRGAAFHKDYIIIKPYGGNFYVVDRKTGKQQHYFNGNTNSGCGTPTIAGNFAFVGTGVFDGDLEAIKAFRLTDAPREQGRCSSLHVVDLQTGKSAWFFGTGNTICGDPAIAYGRLYFTSRDGKVYCFVPAKPGESTTPNAVDRSEPAPPEQVQALLQENPPPTQPGSDWPMQGKDATRAGTGAPALKLPLELTWKSKLGDRIWCGAALADGKVFAGSDAGEIVAIDAAVGKQLWKFATGAPVRCTPAVADGMVYCGSDSGKFYGLDAVTGKQKWTFTCGGPVQASPAMVGGVVLFGAHDTRWFVCSIVIATSKSDWVECSNE